MSGSEDKRELLQRRITEQIDTLNGRLMEAMDKDKVMRAFDVVALEAIHLKVADWDKMTFNELRDAIRAKRAAMVPA